MKKHLFLCGPTGCGKTTLIRTVLGSKAAEAGGFVTERILSSDGKLIGFDMFPAAHMAGIEGFEGKRFLDYTSAPPTKDNEVFREDGVRLLKESEYYSFSVLDEFGGFELVIPQFREALLDALSSSQPCIGVIKSIPNARELQQRFGIGERYIEIARSLRAALDKDEDTAVIDMNGFDDPFAVYAVKQWADEYAK